MGDEPGTSQTLFVGREESISRAVVGWIATKLGARVCLTASVSEARAPGEGRTRSEEAGGEDATLSDFGRGKGYDMLGWYETSEPLHCERWAPVRGTWPPTAGFVSHRHVLVG